MASCFLMTPLHIPSLVIFCQCVCSLQSKQSRIIKSLLTLGAQGYPLTQPFSESLIHSDLISENESSTRKRAGKEEWRDGLQATA